MQSPAAGSFGQTMHEIQAGRVDESHFDRVYRSSARPLLSYVARVSQDSSLAEEIVQATFFRFLQSGGPTMDEKQTRQYLFRIASNLLADHWRSAGRERRFWSFVRPEPPIDRRETRLDVRKIFEMMKPQQREILWLAHVEGCTHGEIADILELREKSVRVLLFRARKRLQDLLATKGLQEEIFR